MSLELVAKDHRLVDELAAELQVSIAATRATAAEVAASVVPGWSHRDMAALAQFLDESSGVPVRQPPAHQRVAADTRRESVVNM